MVLNFFPQNVLSLSSKKGYPPPFRREIGDPLCQMCLDIKIAVAKVRCSRIFRPGSSVLKDGFKLVTWSCYSSE
jgi:hypothetical protein